MRRQRSKGAERLGEQQPGRRRGNREGMWVGMELSLGVPGSLDGNCAGFGSLEEGMMECRRLVEVVHLTFCPFSGNDRLQLESSMDESRLRTPDPGR